MDVNATDPTNPVIRRSSLLPWSTAGGMAASAWLADVSLATPSTRWSVEIALGIAELPADRPFEPRTDTRFHLRVYSEEWGFFFCHRGRRSWIRVTDVAFAHSRRDDFDLLRTTPLLSDIGRLIRALEVAHDVRFRRDLAGIRTDLSPTVTTAIRRWVATV
jgi:hypothetical protein